ncbi:integrin alpha-4-like [Melitaea cinxia]|uniref:integrin alpha-4-like n=1 Tax=Melitaea cinxia TaxID=113334 RepID=UPI001E26F438|nr:integrin alpha-4-like [Melitaea cinxia]
MFGATLCSANLGDVALLVGAPAYADSDYTYDIGAVYIYKAQSGSDSNEMTLKRKIKGKSNGGYFGNAIISLGDMDGDFKDEIAIAAPYDDGGRGAVYIYTGEGLLQGKVSQKIQPEGLTNFGQGLTVVEDFDKNGVNDLAVSSIDNSSVILLRSIAVITVNLYTKFPNLQDNKNKTYFEFQTCLNVQYPEKLNDIKTDVIITIVTTDSISKLVDADEKGVLTYEVSLRDKNESYCKNIGVSSILTPAKEYNLIIAYKISATLKDNPLEMDDFDISRVILSERSVLSVRGDESITDCGDGICVPIWKHSMNSSIS